MVNCLSNSLKYSVKKEILPKLYMLHKQVSIGNLAYWEFSQWADALLGRQASLNGRCAPAAYSVIFIIDTGLSNQIC